MDGLGASDQGASSRPRRPLSLLGDQSNRFFHDDAEGSDGEQETLSVRSSWKDKYVEARPCSWFFDSFDPFRMIRRRRRDLSSWSVDYWFIQDTPEEEKTVPPRVDRSGGLRRQKLARNDYKMKWHGGGAIHSASSRYRWKHC
jgi:hypothetical protein